MDDGNRFKHQTMTSRCRNTIHAQKINTTPYNSPAHWPISLKLTFRQKAGAMKELYTLLRTARAIWKPRMDKQTTPTFSRGVNMAARWCILRRRRRWWRRVASRRVVALGDTAAVIYIAVCAVPLRAKSLPRPATATRLSHRHCLCYYPGQLSTF